MMRVLFLLVCFAFSNNSTAQLYRFYTTYSAPSYYRYEYSVLKESGSTDLCKSRFRVRKKTGFFLKCDGVRLYPYQTKSISTINHQGDTVEMFPFGSTWLQTIREGKINLFSTNTEKYVDWSTHYQKSDDNKIYALNHKDSCYNRLINMVSDNPRAYKMMRNSLRLSKARRYNFYFSVSCLAFTVGTIILHPQVSQESGVLNIATNATLACFVGTFFTTMPILLNMPERRRYKALRVYNSWDKGNHL